MLEVVVTPEVIVPRSADVSSDPLVALSPVSLVAQEEIHAVH